MAAEEMRYWELHASFHIKLDVETHVAVTTCPMSTRPKTAKTIELSGLLIENLACWKLM
jgi:hypothetical protein